MSLFQIRGRDGNAYRPGRDIAYVFQNIARNAAYRLSTRDGLNAVSDYAAHTGVTEQHLAEAAAALAAFVSITANPGLTSGDRGDFMAAWTNAGLDRVHKAALLILMFEIGFGTTTAYFNAAREVTQVGRQAPGADAIADVAMRAASAVKTDLPSARERQAQSIEQVIRDSTTPGS